MPLKVEASSRVESAVEKAHELGSTIETSSRSGQAALKEECLRREGYRCAVTGFTDGKKYLVTIAPEGTDVQTRETHLSHIIPVCMFQFSNDDEVSFLKGIFAGPLNKRQRFWVTQIWAALYHFFPSLEWLTAEHIMRPENALTLWSELNKPFGELRIAFGPNVRLLIM